MTKSVISEKKYHKASCTIKLPFFNVIVWLMCKILSRSYYRVLHKHRTSNQSPWLPKTLVMWSPCANWWAPHQQISILLWLASTAAKEVSLHKSMSRRHHDIVLRKYQLMLIHLAIVDNMFANWFWTEPFPGWSLSELICTIVSTISECTSITKTAFQYTAVR